MRYPVFILLVFTGYKYAERKEFEERLRMAEIIITSFFTSGGSPITGLTPSIRIWEVDAADQTLLIGATEGLNGAGPVGGGAPAGAIGADGTMLEMHDKTAAAAGSGGLPLGGSQDGFYRYVFDTVNGYDPDKAYVFRVDGGVAQPNGERYQAGEFDATSNADQMVDLFYNEPKLEHLVAGSFGEAFNQDNTNIADLVLDVAAIEVIVTLLCKYETNRTKIYGTAKTMIIYDDDCVTPLRTFSLRDAAGVPSTTDICERIPTAAGTSDGKPTCA